MFHTTMTAQAIDDVLADTFPASDPPAWTPGMARPAAELPRRRSDAGTAPDEASDVRTSGVVVSRVLHSERTFAQALVSLAGAAASHCWCRLRFLQSAHRWRSLHVACSKQPNGCWRSRVDAWWIRAGRASTP